MKWWNELHGCLKTIVIVALLGVVALVALGVLTAVIGLINPSFLETEPGSVSTSAESRQGQVESGGPDVAERPEQVRSEPEPARRPETDRGRTEAGVSYAEIRRLFSADSNLTDLQKDEQWKEYRGECVKWRGELVHLDEGLFGGLDIGFRHRRDTLLFDVLVSAPRRKKKELLEWNIGQVYEYEAELEDPRPGVLMPVSAKWGC